MSHARVGPSRKPGIELRQMRAFVALVDHRTMTRAADNLGLAQSTVSEALVALERALGVRLVVRHGGGQGGSLTDAGRALLPYARKALAVVDDAHAAVVGATTRANVSIEIIANESISTYLLPPVLARLGEQWPNARFSVAIGTCPDVRAGVATGVFDVGLLLAGRHRDAHRPTKPSSLRSVERRTVTASVPLLAFGAATHPLLPASDGRIVRPEALMSYPLFVTDATGDLHTLIGRFVKRGGHRLPRLESTGSVEGVKKRVLEPRNGIGFLPAYAIAEEANVGTIAPLTIRPVPPLLRLDALLSRTRVQHPATNDLLMGLIESCRQAVSRFPSTHS